MAVHFTFFIIFFFSVFITLLINLAFLFSPPAIHSFPSIAPHCPFLPSLHFLLFPFLLSLSTLPILPFRFISFPSLRFHSLLFRFLLFTSLTFYSISSLLSHFLFSSLPSPFPFFSLFLLPSLRIYLVFFSYIPGNVRTVDSNENQQSKKHVYSKSPCGYSNVCFLLKLCRAKVIRIQTQETTRSWTTRLRNKVTQVRYVVLVDSVAKLKNSGHFMVSQFPFHLRMLDDKIFFDCCVVIP